MTHQPETDTSTATGSAADDEGWRIFRGDGLRRSVTIPEAPPWRRFGGMGYGTTPGESPYVIGHEETDVINAAIHLRRPLLVTGHPGTGKSSLAAAIAHELDLGPVLHWPVNSRSTLQEALYRYDAIGRLQQSGLNRSPGEVGPDIGSFLRLGPVGTAFVATQGPRVLLVDELDKGDIDLPNDLLTIFEEGTFEIPELSRLPEDQADIDVLTADPHQRARVHRGMVRCTEFPLVVITSNGERDFPPAFRRRCLPLHLGDPDKERLEKIIESHLGPDALADAGDLVQAFLAQRAIGELATDQLLNAVFLRHGGARLDGGGLLRTVLHRLNADG
ncbi:MoxR family ATPase [Streptomyces scabiei]|uniref:MoxR family ATPase n=1 Tax=Streptomyces europaeiscabiei TaxID=146819 RepID=A0ABU4NUW2_9ACTN|nr:MULTISPECIES: MoxR family ATPase [Streptomyces]MBP5865008.1 MoxR family ATPase [Streptomyces sp. LBUM 1484]MBP5874316.1 MoxR family ATPase [Streptomyces sp. LBUM 1477]MBP5882050.1 MoxR family ATPase [Streptomyces sp. LBUM 1487]MBP5895069.1 MoxR family ATPase [Streptomyces sp. LBUM 1481]MBP5897827.1 MoxR family ATPase [Streptomyces sp. LBUM 1488]